MTAPVLLAVVEVPQDERVRCTAQGCGHSVYRRVHLVRVEGTTKVYGSDCFVRLFGATPTGRVPPKFGGAAGRSLTTEERALLLENTERLIEQFEREHQAELAEAEKRRLLVAERQALSSSSAALQYQSARQPIATPHPPVPTSMQREEAEAQARKNLRERFPGVNLDLPGFTGLVRMEVEKILRANAA